MLIRISWFSFLIILSVCQVVLGGEFCKCSKLHDIFQTTQLEFDCGALEDRTISHNEAFNQYINKKTFEQASKYYCLLRVPYSRKAVTFKNCRLSYIPHILLQQLGDPTKINLNNSGIEKIYSEDLHTTFQLIHLSMSQNNLSALPALLLVNTPDIWAIDFSYNQIKQLDAGIFNGTRIKEINFAHNSIEAIPAEIFDSLNDLREVDFSYNQLETFLPDLRKFNYLGKLDLSNNKIARLGCNIYANTESEYIQLQLTISQNRLVLVDLDCDSRMKGTAVLNIEDNLLERLSFPPSILIQNGLDAVVASRNKINKISVETGLTQLKSLNLSSNSLANVSDLLDLFKYGSSLETLDLSFNNLKLGANSLMKLFDLKILYLNNMNLSEFGYGTLSHSRNLKRLDLSHNRLQQFDFNSFLPHSMNIEELRLNNNRITNFIGSTNNLRRLRTLNILNNNFECRYLSHLLEQLASTNIWLEPEPNLEPDDSRINLGGVTCSHSESNQPHLGALTLDGISSCLSQKLQECLNAN